MRRSFKGGSDNQSVLRGLASSKVESLEAAVCKPAVKCRWDSADCVLEEGKALFELRGVERCATHEDIRMSIDVLGDGVYDNVRAMVERILDVGTEKGVVYYHHDAMLMCNGCNVPNIHKTQGGIAGRFDPDELRLVRPDHLCNIQFDARREGDLDAMSRSNFGKVSMGAAVDIGDRDNVRASGKRLEDVGRGCRAGRES